jgi:predicted branched-subunit amino acid permease
MSHQELASNRDAFRAGMRKAFGVPAAVLFAGMVGFGALGHASGLSLSFTASISVLMYALPGQVVFVEMIALGASGAAVALATMLTAARFLPMTLTLVPQIPPEDRKSSLYGVAHFIAMTSWAVMMREFDRVSPERRMAYLTGFGLTCWSMTLPGTALGFLMAGYMPTPITVGLIMLNPLFFLLSFTEVRARASQLALLIGGISGPIVYGYSPGWSIVICGVVGGTIAFFLEGMTRRWKA